MGKMVKITKDAPLVIIEHHKKKLAEAFGKTNDFNNLEADKQFLMLGYIKVLCVLCAEDMIREQTKISLEG